MRTRSPLIMVTLALLSACSGTDCGPKTALRSGDPCGDRLFTYCPKSMLCCLSGNSEVPICTIESQCRQPLLGEACDELGRWGGYVRQCDHDLTCQNRRCICAPTCSSASLCWRDESACEYECCRDQERCVNGRCVAPDSGPSTGRDMERDGPRDAAVERGGDAARDLQGAEPGGELGVGSDGGLHE